jgi:nucleotide-binding universal stress UspA family protein
MFERIVVAVDGSEVCEPALNYAVNLARQNNANLTGVFVVGGSWPDFIEGDWESTHAARHSYQNSLRRRQEDQALAAHRQFEEAAGGLEDLHFSVLTGDPAEVLIRLANTNGVGLLVASRRVYRASGRPSIKFLAKTLSQQASRPLLLLP